MIQSITLDGPSRCHITTEKQAQPNQSIIVVDWLHFHIESQGWTRIEMLTGDQYTVWYASRQALVKYAPRTLPPDEIEKLTKIDFDT